jgi:hypothetical protein
MGRWEDGEMEKISYYPFSNFPIFPFSMVSMVSEFQTARAGNLPIFPFSHFPIYLFFFGPWRKR